MRIPALAGAAAVLVFGLAACGGSIPTAPPAQSPTAAAPTESPAYGTTASPTRTTTRTPTEGTTAATGGQTTADAAGQTFLRAFGTGDAKAACAVMSTETSPLASDQVALDRCATVIQGLMDLVKDQASELKDATVSGATVSGDSATFTNATIAPALAESLLRDRTAVRIDGKWYINS